MNTFECCVGNSLTQFLFVLSGYLGRLSFINSQTNKNINDMKDQVIEEIKRLCGKVEWMPGLGHYFLLNNTLCLYMYCKGTGSLRFAIPYLAKATKDNKIKMMDLVNQTNREVKYIKATLLDNGSLTLTYDHKVMKGENPQDFVPHIINALGFASNYIIEKIGE